MVVGVVKVTGIIAMLNKKAEGCMRRSVCTAKLKHSPRPPPNKGTAGQREY